MANESPPRQIQLYSGLIVLGIFLAGAVTGAGVFVWLKPSRFFPFAPAWQGGDRVPPHLAELHLTNEQQAKARAISERYRPAFEAILKESFPRIRELQDRMDGEIRGILTDEQAKRFDELRLRRPLGPRGMGPPGFGPSPGPPGLELPPSGPPRGEPPGRPPSQAPRGE